MEGGGVKLLVARGRGSPNSFTTKTFIFISDYPKFLTVVERLKLTLISLQGHMKRGA